MHPSTAILDEREWTDMQRIVKLASIAALLMSLSGVALAQPGPLPGPGIPEPATIALVALGIGAAAWAKRRKKP